jgi:Tol biopolymer transport system component
MTRVGFGFSRDLSGIALFALWLFLATSAQAQYFGKNKVQYQDFHWRYVQSEHFDVYFTDGGESVAEFTAETAEQALEKIQRSFDYKLEDRITFVTYLSHNNFEQTNVSLDIPEEGLGGFTEFLKNRVVIPFDGGFEDYRHVIHHELTHAVMLRMLYGSGFQSILIGAATMQLPLWFSEGLAEYESRGGWDTESDMFMRDATISGYLPDMDMLNGYMIYKGGQSILYFVDQRYGSQKIGEILNKLRSTRDLEKALQSAIGLDMKELNRRWKAWVERIYWPNVAEMKAAGDFSERLTDHTESHNFVNNGPALSPDGEKVAFLSDRTGYFDLYVLDVNTKKLEKVLRGERSGNFEELKWLDSRISWSPDGRMITFASKAGRTDAIYLLDVKKKKVRHHFRWRLDAMFKPTWSPDGKKIAFVGVNKGQSDIYYVDIATGELHRVTEDVFSDDDPAWSPDSKAIVFTSDRRDSLRVTSDGSPFKMHLLNYSQTDIYLLTLGEDSAKRITDTETNERAPVFAPDGVTLVYSSDANGVYNLYRLNLETGVREAFTNCLTGCLQPSYSANTRRLVFTALDNGGYDVFLLKDALEQPAIQLTPTPYRLKGKIDFEEIPLSSGPARHEAHEPSRSYAHYVFAVGGGIETKEPHDSLKTATSRLPGGGFTSKAYRVKLTPDFVYATAAYSSFFGVQGTSQILFSDVLGNHLLYLNTDLYYDFNNLDNTNFAFEYYYLPRRINYGVSLYRNVYYLDAGEIRDRTIQVGLYLAYPFTKYARAEFDLTGHIIDRDEYNFDVDKYQYTSKRRAILPQLAYVHDTVLWGLTGPINGDRYRFSYAYAPALQSSSTPNPWGASFYVAKGDVRHYMRLGRRYTWAARVTGGFSGGEEPPLFFLGGVWNWINRNYSRDIPISDIDDFYFGSFVVPFRGGNYFDRQGTRFFLTNQEFRFPMIRELKFGWPLPLELSSVQGAIYTDIGTTWNGDNLRIAEHTPKGWHLRDLQMGFGLGPRLQLGFVVLQWDIAWRTDLLKTTKAVYYLSLGSEF